MQTDVLSAHLNSSGFAVLGRYRLKNFLYIASATAGTINIYDTTAVHNQLIPLPLSAAHMF